jgi:hypothetical protein
VTTSFTQSDLRISLLHSIFNFIETEERGVTSGLKIRPPPKCFEFLSTLKIFKSILKNKVIHVDFIPELSTLRKIMGSNDVEETHFEISEQIISEEANPKK